MAVRYYVCGASRSTLGHQRRLKLVLSCNHDLQNRGERARVGRRAQVGATLQRLRHADALQSDYLTAISHFCALETCFAS